MFREMIANHCFANDAVYTTDEQAQLSFLSGKSVMYFGATWSLARLIANNDSNIDIGAFPLKANDNDEIAAIPLEAGGDFAINKDTAYPEEAIDFLLFTLDPENNLIVNNLKHRSPFKDVDCQYHNAMQEYNEWLSNELSVPFAITQQKWPDGAPYPDPIVKYMKDCFVGRREMTAEEFWTAQDNAWNAAYVIGN
jgi:ABC-type glycerol-3-phosphate transport system substrate-binding protein